jgi:hypothetical protein
MGLKEGGGSRLVGVLFEVDLVGLSFLLVELRLVLMVQLVNAFFMLATVGLS